LRRCARGQGLPAVRFRTARPGSGKANLPNRLNLWDFA
jgi:hypothetical protein